MDNENNFLFGQNNVDNAEFLDDFDEVSSNNTNAFYGANNLSEQAVINNTLDGYSNDVNVQNQMNYSFELNQDSF